jgi:hypothetical protein
MLLNKLLLSAVLDEVMAQYLPGLRGGLGEDTPIRLPKEVIGRPGCGSVNDMTSQGLGWRGHTYGTPQWYVHTFQSPLQLFLSCSNPL